MTRTEYWTAIAALGIKPVYHLTAGVWEFKYLDMNGVSVCSFGSTIDVAAENFGAALQNKVEVLKNKNG